MMRLLIPFAIFLFVISTAARVPAKQIPPNRKAVMGAMVSMDGNQLKIDSILPATTFDAIGLKKNDVILNINGILINSTESYVQTAGVIRAGDKVSVVVKRSGRQFSKSGVAVMKPFEVNEYADIIYDWLPFKEGALRIIVKKPKDSTSCPFILFIPGYNCSSIEGFPSNYNGKLINEWLKAGYGVVCVEKSGNGDSYNCAPCTEVDMKTDLETYSKAYEYMQQLKYADTNNLFIWGHSMGGVIAPVVAEKYQPKGVIVFATVFRPWSEFLLEMHRVQYPLDGKSYEETEAFVREMHRIYYEFFVMKKSPEQLCQVPEFKDLVASELEYKPGNTQMWGRHWRFWQQIDSLNLAESWSHVNGKVLSIYGGADFIQCSELEQKLVAETVNAIHPGNATYLKIDDIDHIMSQNNSWKESSEHLYDKKYQATHFNYEISTKTIEWLGQITRLR